MTDDLIAGYLRDAERRRARDPRIDVLLEVGFIVARLGGESDLEELVLRTIRVARCTGEPGDMWYLVDDLTRAPDNNTVFSAKVTRDGSIEWEAFEIGDWQKHLTAWYEDIRRPKLPRVVKFPDATGRP